MGLGSGKQLGGPRNASLGNQSANWSYGMGMDNRPASLSNTNDFKDTKMIGHKGDERTTKYPQTSHSDRKITGHS